MFFSAVFGPSVIYQVSLETLLRSREREREKTPPHNLETDIPSRSLSVATEASKATGGKSAFLLLPLLLSIEFGMALGEGGGRGGRRRRLWSVESLPPLSPDRSIG